MYNLSKMETMNSAEAIPFVDKQPAFRKMFTIAEVANMSEAELAAYNISQEDQWTANAVIDYAEKQGEERGIKIGMEKGMEKGMAKGAEQERNDFLRSMFDANLPIGDVAKFSRLQTEEVLRLKALYEAGKL